MDSPIPPNDIGHQLALSPTHFTTENQASSPEKALPSPDSSCHLSWEDSQDRNRDQTTTTKWLPERLTRLIQLASQTPDIAESDSNVLHDCLDTIESLLLDPRPNITREIIRCRPSSPHSMPKLQPPRPQLVSSSSALTSDRSMAFTTSPTQTSEKSQHSQLEELRDDVAMLSVQLNQRRNEAFQIYGLLSQEREKLASKISELETEIRELRTDMIEDLAEREALQGTVSGLESWISGWQAQRDLAIMKQPTKPPRQGGRTWWAKNKTNQPHETKTDALLEGITAWMRGWRDVEEGFRNREGNRQLKRNERWRSRTTAGVM